MSWLNAFELTCYVIVAALLVHLIRRKAWNDLFTFGAAALVGYFMELAAVAVTDIYYYNPAFWLNVGRAPGQFPVFGGLMWGGLTVVGLRLAGKLRFGRVMTALTAGMLIVTMDILLDVVAIRLDGGFWVWVGNPIGETVTQHTFLSVIWVNFLGYMIETPAVALLTDIKRRRVRKDDFRRQTAGMLLIALGAILVTAAGSLAALGLNALTDDWFACIAFAGLWLFMLAAILRQAVRVRLCPAGGWNRPVALFWAAMYAYGLAATAHLGLATALPWFAAIGVLFAAGTLYLCVSEPAGK